MNPPFYSRCWVWYTLVFTFSHFHIIGFYFLNNNLDCIGLILFISVHFMLLVFSLVRQICVLSVPQM
jgi:hypothetical protein